MARALVIDDDIANCRLVSKYLQSEGHQTVTHTNSQAGLDEALTRPPDLVVLDVMMPGMDGFEVCRTLRARDATREIPVLFLSARGDLLDRVAGLDFGAVDYLVKPVAPEELLARVRAALRTKALQDQLRAANATLRLIDQNRQELVSMLAHDIRGMIGAVASAVEMAQLDLEALPPRDAHRFLGIAERNITELSDLTTNLLDTYRLDEGRMRPHLHAVDLGSLTEDVVERLAGQAAYRSVELQIVGHALEPVLADHDLLGRVLLNLVTNALKFSPLGGRVTVDLDAKLTPPDGHEGIVVAIHDDGPGIPESERTHLFERFTPLALPGGRRPVGSGLGLEFCRRAMDLMGGVIWLEPGSNRGSTFAFTIPLAGDDGEGQR